MDKTPIVLRWWFIVLEVIVFIIAFVAFKVSIILGLNVLLVFLILLFFTLKAAFPERFEKINKTRLKKLKEKNAPREFKHKRNPAPVAKMPVQYNSQNLQSYVYEASFPQATHFHGFKRIYLSVGDYEPVLEDIAALKAIRPDFDLSGTTITLKLFYLGIQVYVNDYHIGTFWDDSSSSPSNYKSVAEGKVEKAYVRISKKESGRYSSWLYLKFK
jgi:hypothetical protein